MTKERTADTLARLAQAPRRAPPPGPCLRVDVSAADGIDAQARAYAEYRIFAGLAGLRGVRSARVVLRRQDSRSSPLVACSVSVAVEAQPVLRVRTSGSHTYQAINRAADRLRLVTRAADERASHG